VLILDVLFLALFGPGVEAALGRARFCGLCLLGGLSALAAGALLHGARSHGASLAYLPHGSVGAIAAVGSVAAVLGGYALLHPRARVLTLVVLPLFGTIVEIPALPLLGLWLLAQVTLGVFA
jgi:membrane associated rhomboid family serine protease